MNRREFLQCAAVLVAGAAAPPASWALSEEQKVFLASQPNYIDRVALTFFSESQRAAVMAVADQIIPTTDSPGALDADTPRFIELMVSDWFNDDERNLFMNGLADLQKRADGAFEQLSAPAQLQLLEKLEEEAGDASWYQLGSVLRIWDDTAPFICQVKELTVLGFMFSEVAANNFLRQNSMGAFQGDIPLGPSDAAYAAEMPIRLMAGSE